MVFTGHVQNGSVVFDTPIPLPDGTPVRVEATAPAPAPAETSSAEEKPKTLAERWKNLDGVFVDLPPDSEPTFYDRYKDFIGAAELPEDAAENHDHYLYGTPKKGSGAGPQ